MKCPPGVQLHFQGNLYTEFTGDVPKEAEPLISQQTQPVKPAAPAPQQTQTQAAN